MENKIIFNPLEFWMYVIIEYQKFLMSGMNIMQVQSSQFTSKKENSYDVDWPKDLYIDGRI